ARFLSILGWSLCGPAHCPMAAAANRCGRRAYLRSDPKPMNPPTRLIALRMLACCLAFGFNPGGTTCAQTRSIKHSSPLTAADPQRVGVSPERLARIDAMCEEAIKSGSIPGV